MAASLAGQFLDHAAALRRELGEQFHDRVSEAIYTEAAQNADRSVTRVGQQAAFRLDRAIDRAVTSRIWGFPLMILLLTGVF